MTADGEAPNHSILREVALALEPILDSLTFVGGQVVELLITDPVAVSIRATLDVDAVVPAASTAEYKRVGERLVELGFRHDTMGGVIDEIARLLDHPNFPDAVEGALRDTGEISGFYSVMRGSFEALVIPSED